MRRSDVNRILREADDFLRAKGFHLPPFAYWSPDFFRQMRAEARPIIEDRLGWDITDYGEGRFDQEGLFLFTVRNGRFADLQAGGGRVYAEKAMISRKNQISPMHRHNLKTEDIINRGGGLLVLQLFNSTLDGSIDRLSDVKVLTDGLMRTLPAGGLLKLEAGESVTLPAGNWHKFWAEDDDVFIGEVSTVNDDLTDNVFEKPIGRFSTIEEDEPPLYLLVSDYDKWLS